MTVSNIRHRSWREISDLLANDNNKKLNLKILDTVFLERDSDQNNGGALSNNCKRNHILISNWIYTSKRGNIVKRKQPHTLTLRHVYERFCRFALANPSNAKGSKIICSVHGKESNSSIISHLTVEQLERVVQHFEKGKIASTIISFECACCTSLQCYIEPFGGHDQIFRAFVTSHAADDTADATADAGATSGSADNEDNTNSNTFQNNLGNRLMLKIYCIKDSIMTSAQNLSTTQMEDIGGNIEYQHISAHLNQIMKSIARYLESQFTTSESICEEIITLTADFIYDEKCQFWLSKVHKLATKTEVNRKNRKSSIPLNTIRTASALVRNAAPQAQRFPFKSSLLRRKPLSASSPKLRPLVGLHQSPMFTGPPCEKENLKARLHGKSDTSQMQVVSFAKEKIDPNICNTLIGNAEDEFICRHQVDLPQDDNNSIEKKQRMKNQLSEMESKVSRTKKIMLLSAKAAEDERDDNLKLKQQISSMKEQFITTLQKKENEHYLIILHLKSELSSCKAEVVRLKSLESSVAETNNRKDLQTTLIMKIKSLHQEIQVCQRSWGEEKRSILSSQSAFQQQQAAKHREELSQNRAEIATMEDKVASQKELTMELEKEKIILIKKINDSEIKIEHMSNKVINLERDLKLMKQSVKIVQSNFTAGDESHTEGKKDENESVLTLNAHIQTLNNKIEFLKDQLAIEARLKNEFMNCISKLEAEKETILTENVSKIQACHDEKEQEIEKMQQKLKEVMEKPIQDIAVLEGKIAKLQAQLGDSVQDASLSKKKEELLRSDLLREQKKLRFVQKELAGSKNENEAALKKIQSLKDYNRNESTNEAMMRRLDNERRYLKNQLQNEVNSKNELSSNLKSKEQEFNSLKDASAAEIESHESRAILVQQNFDKNQKELKGLNQILQAEGKVQKDQLKEIKQAYTNLRDQHRLDQVSTDQLRATCQRLSQELKAAQDEIQHTKIASDEAIARYNESTSAISLSISHAETQRAHEINTSQQEMRKVLMESSETQQEMIKLRQEMEVYKNDFLKNRAVDRITTVIARSQALRIHQAFVKWTNSMRYENLVVSLKKKNSSRINEYYYRIKKQFEEKLNEEVTRIKDEKKAFFEKIEGAAIEERNRVRQLVETDQKKAGDLEKKRIELLEERKQGFMRKELELKESYKMKIIQLEKEFKHNVDERNRNHEEELKNALDKCNSENRERESNLLSQVEYLWTTKYKKRETEFKKNMECALNDASLAHRNELATFQSKYEIDRSNYMNEVENKVKNGIQEERERFQVEMSCAIDKNEEKWSSELREVTQDYEKEAAKLKVTQSEEMKLIQLEHKSTLESKQREWETQQKSILSSSIQSAIDKEKKIQVEVLQTEREKWRNTINDMEKKMQSELKAQYEKGFKERNAEAIKEKEHLNNSANIALEKVKQSAQDSLEEALAKSAKGIKYAQDSAEKDKNCAIAQIQQMLKQSHDRNIEEIKRENKKEIEEERRKILNKERIKKENAVCEAEERERSFARRLEEELNNEIEKRRKAEANCTSRVEEIRRFAEDEIMKRVSESERYAKKMIQDKEKHITSQYQTIQEEQEKRTATKLVEVERKCRQESEDLMKDMRRSSEDTIARTVKELEQEHNSQINKLQDFAKNIEKEHIATKFQLNESKSIVLELKNKLKAADRSCSKIQKESSFRFIVTLTKVLRQQESSKKELRAKDQDLANAIKTLNEESLSERRKLELLIKEKEQNIDTYKNRQQQMYRTLVNHKREILIKQKQESVKMSGQLDEIRSTRIGLEDERKDLELQMRKMEEGIQQVERQMQLHSSISTIKDGRVNIAHARKKRRLDEEYELLLENIEVKRDQINKIDMKLKTIVEKKDEADDRMKKLERTLVEVLVEQQKKLLAILSSNEDSN